MLIIRQLKRTIRILFLLLLHIQTWGQNHVPNASFEQKRACPPGTSNETGSIVTQACINWWQYTVGGSEGGSTDYFHACFPDPDAVHGVGVPKNKFGYQYAVRDSAYIGCYTYTHATTTAGKNYKEYAATKIDPIKPQYTYEVSMSVSLADNSLYGTDDLGVYFFDKAEDSVDIDYVLPVIPQVSYSSYGPITDKNNWTRLVKVYTPDSIYSRIVIGGFKDSNNVILATTASGNPTAYYYIDSVVVKIFKGIKINLNDTTFCPGNQVSIPYTVDSTTFFQPGNVFTAQLSDSGGDFTFPKDIGSVTSTTSGVIDCTIPANSLNGGNYQVRIKSSNPVAYFYADAVIGIYKLRPEATTTAPVCEGSPFRLSVNEKVQGVQLSWSGPLGYTGMAADTIITPAKQDMGGVYTVIATLQNCTGSDTTAVLVKILPEKPVISNNSPVYTRETIELKVTNVNAAYQYSWDGPDITLQGPVAVIYDARTKHRGNYIARAVLDGCENNTSTEVDVIDEASIGYFYMYPVPNDGNFTVEGLVLADQYIRWRIVNEAGQLIMEDVIETKNRRVKQFISMPFVASGIYYLHLRADGKDKTIPFTVKH